MPTRKSFVEEGWGLLHEAVLRIGAEVDYYPPDEPELGARSYVSPEHYRALVSPLIELSGIDIETLGNRSTLIKRAIWRWIRKTAFAEAPHLWKLLLVSRNRTQVLAGFSDILAKGQFADGPKLKPSSPASAIRFGHWLIHEYAQSDSKPIVYILWGLALIAASWRGKMRRGYCRFCFRKTFPGSEFCDFHRQRGISPQDRSSAYIRYRKGKLATALMDDQEKRLQSFLRSTIRDHETSQQALSVILFPMFPPEGWADRKEELVDRLVESPRVLRMIGGKDCLQLPFEEIADRLREHIDPFEFDDFMWWHKVVEAEKWLLLEERAAPGKRGKGKATQLRVASAIELAQDGVKNGEIASRLGIAPSTVSSWIKRYPEFRFVCMERDCGNLPNR